MRVCSAPTEVVEVIEAKVAERGEKAAVTATIRSLLGRQSTRSLLILDWTFSFLIIVIDETLLLYCTSKNSGLRFGEMIDDWADAVSTKR